MLGQDVKLADDLRQLAIAGRVEGEGDLAVAGFFNLDDVAVIGGELRTVFFEGIEGKDHVFGRDRLAVVPFRLSTQPIGGRGKIVRITDGFGEQTIFGRHFVERRHQEGVVNGINAGRERAFDACHHNIEIVVGAERDLPRHAAFRRGGVDVFEMFEAGRIFQVAEQ